MLSYLIRQSRRLLLAAGLASVVAGISSVLLIIQINTVLTAVSPAERTVLAWSFAACAVAALLSRVLASVLFERLSQRVHADLRRFISERVMAADFRRLERIDAPNVQSALTEHSAHVAQFFVSVPNILVNVIVVLGCLAYMAWLSWPVFLVAVAVIGLGSLGCHLAHLRAIRHLDGAAIEQDRLFGHFRSLVEGAKELRLHAVKRGHFANNVLGDSIEVVRRERTVGMSVFVASAAWGHFLIYAFIGLVLFALLSDTPDRVGVMTGFAMAVIYMVSPLENLLLRLPSANLARASGARIDDITQQLAQSEVGAASAATPRMTHVSLRGVAHRYYHECSDDLFTLGPVRLDFAPGQITFLVGGNGSGKTSLAKLLVGLYQPEQGSILWDGVAVEDTNRDAYRQCFSAIFSDFHLFECLLDGASPELDVRGNRLIEKLHLHHKVQMQGGAFSTRALSQGQRKRLALVVAYLEERPFMVFDEWAADQDPVFKEVFYRELLPELKALGKCVLVISHDDRYFHGADRIVRMESGQIISVDEQ